MLKPAFFLLVFIISLSVWALPDESQFFIKGSLFSYYSSHDLTKQNSEIEKVIISLHGSERNASTYFNSISGLSQRLGVERKVLVIAPHFKLPSDSLMPHELSWDSEGWLRGDESLNNSLVSSFELLDSMISQIGRADVFPQLKDIVITGHSAGGQFVQRYAVGSQIQEDFSRLHFRFIVTNPGSYLYLTQKRPFTPQVVCQYNDYKFGLNNLNNYMKRVSIPSLIDRYLPKDVIYFLGEMDTRSDDIDQSCPAQYQGRTRLERGLSFKAQLEAEFPSAQHRLISVPGVGHTQYGMYTSEWGQRILFHEL
jgi:hypothetical protein